MKPAGLLICLLMSCAIQPASAQQARISYADPLTGTQRMGHTYPGATVPFGMVQLSPETDTLSYELDGRYNPDVYRYCAGYQYGDRTITGFSHTHFSGTGHSDLGDFLVMPTMGALQLNPGTAGHPELGYRSVFSHSSEVAVPGYYKVKLEDDDIVAEMTATDRVGLHRYTFARKGDAHIILDLMAGIYNYPGKNVWTFVRMVNDTLLTGYRQTRGWARNRTLYFAMSFSRPVKKYGCRDYGVRPVYKGFWRKFDLEHDFPEMAGEEIRAWFDFDMEAGGQIVVKCALSPVGMDGALRNLRAEASGRGFDEVRQAARQQWESALGCIEVQGPEQVKKNFYTALYHTLINPTLYMDVDSQYAGLDRQVHKAAGFVNYTTFSLWDTYRALHPLFNIIAPARNADMVRSMLAHYEQSPQHMLPVWSNSGNENWCMSGYHSVSVIADAVVKGTVTSNTDALLDACIATAKHRSYEGIGSYMNLGYIPDEESRVSVSTTLEYAYDDWAIARLALKLGRKDVYGEFIKRSQNYLAVYDRASGFMRPRLRNGAFRSAFDPLSTVNEGFIEGNAWNYSLFVPHDPKGLIGLMGGAGRFTAYLDSLFTMQLPDRYFAETEDISRDGIIGNYVHGNEPSHHVAYLYNWTASPWKTQERVRMIMPRMYRPAPDGLGGNDDTGQMSAWYIFSALGFYPVAPGSATYAIGSPSVDKAVIRLEGGRTFTIIAESQSDRNVYLKGVFLNGKPLQRLFLEHKDIMAGGELRFVMTDRHP